jgi:hypothetical protein
MITIFTYLEIIMTTKINSDIEWECNEIKLHFKCPESVLDIRGIVCRDLCWHMRFSISPHLNCLSLVNKPVGPKRNYI